MKQTPIILAAIGIGLLIALATVWLGWLVQIEGRAYQCTDSTWPFAWPSTDMTSHVEAGDTLSPEWTWERIENIGRAYRILFYVLWIGTTGTISGFWLRKRSRTIA